MASATRPGSGPLRPAVPHPQKGGFCELEAWLFVSDFVDLARRRRSFIGRHASAVPWPPRLAPHAPPGVPHLVRDPGRRCIHVAAAPETRWPAAFALRR